MACGSGFAVTELKCQQIERSKSRLKGHLGMTTLRLLLLAGT